MAKPPPFESWLQAKLQMIVTECSNGLSYGDLCESQYLCYLDALVAFRGAPGTVWGAWVAFIRETHKVPVKTPLQPMNHYYGDGQEGRDALVVKLREFRMKLVGSPRRRLYDVRPGDTKTKVAPAESNVLDLLGWIDE